jgi:methionyl-tRNA formyltransferase
VRLVFAGTPEPALPALRALLDSPRHDVVAVLTRPDAPTGRGRRLAASPVAELAVSLGIPVLRPARPAEPGFAESLAAYRPDCCPVVAYGALLPSRLLRVPARGWVNLHFSVLPAWRGAAPVQAAIRHGDEVTGASVFQLEKGMDTGPVFGVVTESIGPRDTSGDLLSRLATSGAELLVATLDGIEDGILRPVPQPADGVSYAPKVTVEDAEVDWRLPATQVDRLIRSPPSRERGARCGVTGSGSARWTRWGRTGWRPVSYGWRSVGCWWVPPPRRCSWAPCGRRASGKCRRRTGRVVPVPSRGSASSRRRPGWPAR